MLNKPVEELTAQEKTEILHAARLISGSQPQKKRMKTSKKMLVIFMIWSLLIQTYVMLMIAQLQDTTSLSIIAGVAFVEVIAFYISYLRYQYGINMKSMEMNYDPNYDENKGVY